MIVVAITRSIIKQPAIAIIAEQSIVAPSLSIDPIVS